MYRLEFEISWRATENAEIHAVSVLLSAGMILASTSVCAQTLVNPPAPETTTTGEPEVPTDARQEPQFLDVDGNPLPPEIQQQLREQFKGVRPAPKDQATDPVSAAVSSPQGNESGILVSGQRPRGSVTGDLPPERTLSPLEIGAYGASNVEQLISALGPQLNSNAGRGDRGPVTLLNGRRVSSLAEIAQIPTEAIERMEVFPEELAFRYGYQADQKVVNIVTFEKFRSQLGQIGYAATTDGGYDKINADAGYFAIRGNTRFDFGAGYFSSASLLESDRDIAQPPTRPEDARYRTLLPSIEQVTISGLVSGNLLNDVSTTVNGRFEAGDFDSLLGLGSNGPLAREVVTRSIHGGTTSHGRLSKWLWTFTGNFDRNRTTTSTEVDDGLGSGRSQTRSISSVFAADLLLAGTLLRLPAGAVSTTIRGGIERRDFESQSLGRGTGDPTDLSRDRSMMQINVDVPLLRRRSTSGRASGDLSANVNLKVERVSEFGTLRTFGYGFNWMPIPAISVLASVTLEDGAPTLEQLGGARIDTPNLRIFDFSRGELADITQTFGGNPALRSDDRRTLRASIRARPFAAADLTLNFDFISTRIDNPIAPLPLLTPQVEAAFPDRVTRDSTGRLLRIDARPLNLPWSRQEQVSWGINFIRPLSPVPPWMGKTPSRVFSSEADVRSSLPPATSVIMVQPGSTIARSMENLSSRIYASINHTWRLRDEILLGEGLPALDLLNGAILDPQAGRPRHQIDLRFGAFHRGLGARLTGKWHSATTLHAFEGAGDDIRFSDYATLDVNLFVDLATRFGGKSPIWLKGARATISVTNLFNARQHARNYAGSTPLNYQSSYLDPLGRVVSVGLRKAF